MSTSFFSEPKPSASHALVDFGDNGTTIVPFSRIVGGSTEKGRRSMKWADGKQYNAHPLITNEGTYFLLNAHYLYISLHAIVATGRSMTYSLHECNGSFVHTYVAIVAIYIHDKSFDISRLVACPCLVVCPRLVACPLLVAFPRLVVLHIPCKTKSAREIFEFSTRKFACNYVWIVTRV